MNTSAEINLYIQKLKQHHIKKTLPRLEVLTILHEAKCAISAGDIEQTSSFSGHNISLNAVYNVLQTLQVCEIVYRHKTNNKSLYSLIPL